MTFYPLLGQWLNKSNSQHTPLNIESVNAAGFDASKPECDEQYLASILKKVPYVYGGYIEKRNLYERSPLFKAENGFRNIHLGTDIWSEAGTEMFAPMDLKIHSFQDNDNFGDYGPTVIFEGNADFPFILMGHLSRADLQLWSSKTEFKKGEVIGHFGEKHENGGWYPHVHLQVINDLQGRRGDFPGVYAETKLHEVQSVLIDPKDLFYR